MKSFITAAAFALVAGITPALANDSNPGHRAKDVFAQKFTGAENVKWSSVSGEYEKVAFTIGGTRAEAYFTTDGELLGSVRNLIFSQLPLAVMQTLNNQFTGAAVTEIIEVINQDGAGYRVKFELKNKRYSVKIDNLGYVTDEQRQKIKK